MRSSPILTMYLRDLFMVIRALLSILVVSNVSAYVTSNIDSLNLSTRQLHCNAGVILAASAPTYDT
jgi:hypothetical protein